MAEQLAAMRGGNAAYGAAATATAPSPSRAGFTTSANQMYDVEDGDRGGAEGDRSPLLPRPKPPPDRHRALRSTLTPGPYERAQIEKKWYYSKYSIYS